MKIEAGSRVAFARPWLRRHAERYRSLTGRDFPLNSSQRGRVDWVTADRCTGRPRTRVGVVWTDGSHQWFNVLPISALRVVAE